MTMVQAGGGETGDVPGKPVLAAVIVREDLYLICQRPPDKRHGGKWEFPGGKLEAKENHMRAAIRELHEELDLIVLGMGEHLFTTVDPDSSYVIDFVEVRTRGEPRLLEHTALLWLPLEKLHTIDLAPSDMAFVRHLQSVRIDTRLDT